MSQIQFHETRMGATFYRQTLPELVKQLARVADALERMAGKTAMERPSGTAHPGSVEGPNAPGASEKP